MGLRVGLGGFGKSRPQRDSIPGLSSPQRVAISTELSRPPVICEVAWINAWQFLSYAPSNLINSGAILYLLVRNNLCELQRECL